MKYEELFMCKIMSIGNLKIDSNCLFSLRTVPTGNLYMYKCICLSFSCFFTFLFHQTFAFFGLRVCLFEQELKGKARFACEQLTARGRNFGLLPFLRVEQLSELGLRKGIFQPEVLNEIGCRCNSQMYMRK